MPTTIQTQVKALPRENPWAKEVEVTTPANVNAWANWVWRCQGCATFIRPTMCIYEVLLTFTKDAHTVSEDSQIVITLMNLDDHSFRHFCELFGIPAIHCVLMCLASLNFLELMVSIFADGNALHHGAAWHEDLVLKRTLSAPAMPKEEPGRWTYGPCLYSWRQRYGTVESSKHGTRWYVSGAWNLTARLHAFNSFSPERLLGKKLLWSNWLCHVKQITCSKTLSKNSRSQAGCRVQIWWV